MPTSADDSSGFRKISPMRFCNSPRLRVATVVLVAAGDDAGSGEGDGELSGVGDGRGVGDCPVVEPA